MKPIDVLVLGGIAIAIVGVVIYLVRRKQKCGGGCGSCPHSHDCGYKTGDKE